MFRAFVLLADLVFYCVITAVVVTVRNFGFEPALIQANITTVLPLFVFACFTLYFSSYYDFTAVSKNKPSVKNIVICALVNMAAGASFLYFFTWDHTAAEPKTILIAAFLIYHVYIFYSRNIIWNYSLRKENIIIFGKSAAVEGIKSAVQKSKTYKIKGEYELVPGKHTFLFRKLDFIVISSSLFKDDPGAWDIISAQFIHKGIIVKTDFNFFEELFRRAPEEGLNNPAWLLRGISSRNGVNSLETSLKRCVDICFSLSLLPFCLPVGALIYLLIKIFDRMDPLFTQDRIGLLERRLHIYKFRTLRPGTECATRLGAVLRRFRLDEIPQLINIFRGDISIVGPRPVWTKEYFFLNKHINNHSVRSIVKPGLTGWAQLNFKAPPTYCVQADLAADEDFAAAKTRLSYDVWYIKNQSFFLDLEILFKTAKRMFIKDKYVS